MLRQAVATGERRVAVPGEIGPPMAVGRRAAHLPPPAMRRDHERRLVEAFWQVEFARKLDAVVLDVWHGAARGDGVGLGLALGLTLCVGGHTSQQRREREQS